jgi:hypothetical protein
LVACAANSGSENVSIDAGSHALDHVLEFSREKAASAMIARFAYKAGQSAQAIRLQPAMQRPTWDPSVARVLTAR